jgi:lactoylglutathione lyase
MSFHIAHANLNVLNMERSLAFYKKALGMKVVHTHEAEDQSFCLTFLSDAESHFFIELTELRDRKDPYDLGDNESHICFRTDDYAAAYELHREMGCICYENNKMGLYFIEDPDGYWLEITPIPVSAA